MTSVIWAPMPTFRNEHDKIAYAVHAYFLASGYYLTATGPHALSQTALSDPSTGSDEVAIDHWNELDNEYAFVYANPENCFKKLLLKCRVMNDKLLVDVLSQGSSSEPVHLEINVGDYAQDAGSNNIYISDEFKNLDKFVQSLDKNILCKLEGSSSSGSSSYFRRLAGVYLLLLGMDDRRWLDALRSADELRAAEPGFRRGRKEGFVDDTGRFIPYRPTCFTEFNPISSKGNIQRPVRRYYDSNLELE